MNCRSIVAALGGISLSTLAATAGELNSPDVMAAMQKVKIVSQALSKNAFGNTVVVKVSNESSYGFQMLVLSCALMQGDKPLGTVEPMFAGLLPSTTGVDETLYETTPSNMKADSVECRPAVGQ